jgi:hypothetical protein
LIAPCSNKSHTNCCQGTTQNVAFSIAQRHAKDVTGAQGYPSDCAQNRKNPSVAGSHIHSRNYYKLHPLGEFFDEGERCFFGFFGRSGQFQRAGGNPANALVIAQSIDDADSFDPVQGFELTTVQFGLMF